MSTRRPSTSPRRSPLEGARWALPALLALAACGASSDYLWVDDLPRTAAVEGPHDEYVIAAGDMVTIRVYNQDAISTRGRIRPDGKIGVPLGGEVEARGLRPVDLAKLIEAKLKPFVIAPSVTVSVDEQGPLRVSVLGEVAHPGVFAADAGAGVLQALAMAGGPTEYADRERVFVLRPQAGKPPLRIRFSLPKLSAGSGRGAVFTLENGDVVLVE
ncbi:MAG: polysaccharide biosynthesis/export family protein [Byssovorax sp.]